MRTIRPFAVFAGLCMTAISHAVMLPSDAPAEPAYQLPEDTSVYLEWARRADENEARYTLSYRRDRRALEARILRGDIREFMVEDYVLQLQVLGDEARIVELCCRMSAAGPKAHEARKRLFKIAKSDLLVARQYREILRIAGNVQDEYDRLIVKYQAEPVRKENWCELRYKGDCSTEFHDAFAYFEALIGTEQRFEAVVLAEKLIRTQIDPADLMPKSRYTVWELPDDISTSGAIAQLIECAERANDADVRDALVELARGRRTEGDLDAFREAVLGDDAVAAKRKVYASAFVSAATNRASEPPERGDRE